MTVLQQTARVKSNKTDSKRNAAMFCDYGTGWTNEKERQKKNSFGTNNSKITRGVNLALKAQNLILNLEKFPSTHNYSIQ